MTWKNLFAVLAATMMVSNVGASDYCDPCAKPCGLNLCCDPCEGWSAHIDWLYWNVRRCDIDYTAPLVDSGRSVSNIEIYDSIGSVSTVCADYDRGFRIGVQKSCGDIDFGIEYTRYTTDAKSKATGDLVGTWLSDSTTVILMEF